ncbi:membrane protein [Rhodococcus rhodochrous]|nr:membrane protein [Rhodococcus rhodochrous]
MKKALYRPVSLVVSSLAGVAAGMVFRKVWALGAGQDDPPEAMDSRFGWREVLVSAAVQGAIFGAVSAAANRASAVGFRRVTGTWPGEE